MQTLTLQVKDSFVPNLIDFLSKFKDQVTIKKDKNLEYDPYFYERQEELHKLRKDIKNGKMEMLSQKQYEEEIKVFFESLEK